MKKREILFRGKRVDNGEWVEGDFVRITDGDRTTPYIYYYGEVIPETVGQYTGLTDKSGNKIFEGDILVFVDAETPETERAIVVYDDGGYKLKYHNYDYMDDLCSQTALLQVIVGNIHDNPELLEVQNEKHEKAD